MLTYSIKPRPKNNLYKTGKPTAYYFVLLSTIPHVPGNHIKLLNYAKYSVSNGLAYALSPLDSRNELPY